MQLRRVVVTGLGALTPLGNTLQAYWDALVKGTSGAAPITNFDASKFKTQFACEVKGFDPTEFMDRKEARKMDPFSQFAVAASDWKAVSQTADLAETDRDEANCIIETWSYDPAALSNTNTVDVLSLYAQFRDHRDERVAMAADRLLENLPW